MSSIYLSCGALEVECTPRPYSLGRESSTSTGPALRASVLEDRAEALSGLFHKYDDVL